MILSTPKTGNAWFVQLLSHIYDLPVVDVPLRYEDFGEKDFDTPPDRFVAHQHIFPTKGLIDWINSNNIRILTTIRHPASTLLSLINYTAHTDQPELRTLKEALSRDALMEYIRLDYYHSYQLSLLWRKVGSIVVRYEDLLADPLITLKNITSRLGCAAEDKIKAAALICQPNLITRLGLIPKEHIARFKENYLSDLPVGVHEAIYEAADFSNTYRDFGYDINPEKGLKKFDYGAIDPFDGEPTFENGVCLDPYLKYVYYRVGGLKRWPFPAKIEGDSFWNWLFMSSDKLEKAASETVRYYTNFLDFIYESRPDLQAVFPDVLGVDHYPFLKWVVFQASKEIRVSWQFFADVSDFYSDTLPRLA